MTDAPEPFDCPSCGAPLDASHIENNLVACPFCGKSSILPERLQAQPSARLQPRAIQYWPVSAPSLEHAEPEPTGPEPGETVFTPPPAMEALPQSDSMRRTTSGILVAVIALLMLGGALVFFNTPRAPEPPAGMMPGMTVISGDYSYSPANAPTPALTLTEKPDYAKVLMSFGEKGAGPGQLDGARWVTVDPATGSIFVAGYEDGRVQKFDRDGKFVKQLNLGQGKVIQGIAASRRGILYVSAGGEILKYSTITLEPRGTVTYDGGKAFGSIAITPKDELVAVSGAETVVRFDSEEAVTLTIPEAISAQRDNPEKETRVSVDGEGNIYVLGIANDAAYSYTPAGAYRSSLNGDKRYPLTESKNVDILAGQKVRVFVADDWGVKVFYGKGGFIDMIHWDTQELPLGMALDSEGRLVVVTDQQKVYQLALPPEP